MFNRDQTTELHRKSCYPIQWQNFAQSRFSEVCEFWRSEKRDRTNAGVSIEDPNRRVRGETDKKKKKKREREGGAQGVKF